MTETLYATYAMSFYNNTGFSYVSPGRLIAMLIIRRLTRLFQPVSMSHPARAKVTRMWWSRSAIPHEKRQKWA